MLAKTQFQFKAWTILIESKTICRFLTACFTTPVAMFLLAARDCTLILLLATYRENPATLASYFKHYQEIEAFPL